MATIYIDNVPYEVKPGKNLLEACLTLGINLPYFCWHPAMGSVGACRQCAVKVFKDEADTKGRLIMSCMEPVRDNIRLSVDEPEAKEFREHVIEWLMTNHPHDCAVCDEGGACHLQDMTVMSGHNYRRYEYKKRTYQNQYLGPFLNHEMNRCIQCYRCVRFYKDYAGGHDLDVFAAHNHVYFGRHENGVLENEFSGNLAEVCPTGVFTDKTLKQHYTRKWDLTMAPSVCQHCSLGCNISAGERYGSLRQITSRYNGEVNGYFICDRGRFGYEFVNSPARIRKALVRTHLPEAVTKEVALQEIWGELRQARLIGIGSPRASLESNFALKALVGENNFHLGVDENDQDLVDLSLKILRKGPARNFSLREVETADAVFILGEDLTNTAPMLALAVRQSVRQQPLAQVAQASIPFWQDAAARELVQDKKGPLFIASITATKLDEIATATAHASPDAIARLGFAVANLISENSPVVTHLSEAEETMAQQIADALKTAKKPLIISGCASGSEAVLKAAANIAGALCEQVKTAGIVLTVPECNSLGLAMLGGHRLESAFEAIQNGYADSVIILENNLYRCANKTAVDSFLGHAKEVLVLDHLHHATTEKARIVLPAGTFAEADGTLVNNEGRAQRFYQVYPTPEDLQESWRWLINIGTSLRHPVLSNWKNLDDINQALAEADNQFKGILAAAPPAEFRIAGQKIPRESHRFSGRTAMNAHHAVSEPKPPEDPDTPLTFTMEGYRGEPPSSIIPFFWSPGWNSIQSVNKYQEEIGGHLHHGDPGIRLIEPVQTNLTHYFSEVPEDFAPLQNHLFMVPLYHIFGSEEQSILAPGIAQRAPEPYVAICEADAHALQLKEGNNLDFSLEHQIIRLPVKINNDITKGTAGLPKGLPGVPYAELPAWAIILKQETTWKHQPQIIS
ncbi:NADH-quinone oxidoreductase subunit NuoG [Adhaeribacter rhizoryzae]|uniref:NADH-quinone oxidoreductase subunit G n=1 Tax=Adhaeribacter rhizoryzae TaxID=2607907 RepID=A0A5M6DP86_9BACT|nr:NADH-quinone oxidoreductase subunit NuoG [Adhaeribacter rhizoryzae]KAA5549298.1 NADH-quinone oxidoreductase subunit NuoG [Adhaeribacter rhizoryzae]